ncbi:hypothetical protein EMCRGX_G008744 [Ephydatia muelleri]
MWFFSPGGKLVSFSNSRGGDVPKVVTISQVITELDLLQHSKQLEHSLTQQLFADFCDHKSQQSPNERERTLWNFLKPSEDYFCPVMQGLLTNPYQSSCCGNQFSKEAVTQLQQLQKPCSMCRRKRMTFNVDKAWKRKVWSVKIYCPSKQDADCTWSGEISELKRHLKD